jgi:hypothetical protein
LIRQYLLGQLDETAQERVELKLLTDSGYAQEFDITVDEITDQYVAGELSQNERALVEDNFLRAEERREKVAFASALARYAAESTPPKSEVSPTPIKPNFFERVFGSWPAQSVVFRAAAAIALILVVGIVARQIINRDQVYISVALNISNGTRGESPNQQRVVLANNVAGLEVMLRLPEGIAPASDYRVALVDSNGISNDIPITARPSDMLTVRVAASQLKPGTYAFKLFAINADRSEQPINGSYLLVVEY